MGPSYRLQSCRINLLQHGLSTGSIPSGNISLLWSGVLHVLQCVYLLWCDPWAAGKYLLHCGLFQNTHRLQEIISYSSGAPLSPSVTLVSSGLFLTLLSLILLCLHNILPFLNYACTTASFTDGLSCAL